MFCQLAFLESHEPLEQVKLSLSAWKQCMRKIYVLMLETLDPVSFFLSDLDYNFQ